MENVVECNFSTGCVLCGSMTNAAQTMKIYGKNYLVCYRCHLNEVALILESVDEVAADLQDMLDRH